MVWYERIACILALRCQQGVAIQCGRLAEITGGTEFYDDSKAYETLQVPQFGWRVCKKKIGFKL